MVIAMSFYYSQHTLWSLEEKYQMCASLQTSLILALSDHATRLTQSYQFGATDQLT